jgi:pentatricopeptide repeat protein
MDTGSVFGQAIRSMASELIALAIFFVTWIVMNYYMKKKPAGGKEQLASAKKIKRKQTPEELSQVIVGLCQDQFTRSLRLYRDLVKQDQDKEIVDEAFYTALVESSIRVGKADVAEQIILRMHANGMVPSVAFMQSLLKLFAARKCFAECIRAWELFEPQPDQVVYSCLTLASAETGSVQLCRDFLKLNTQHFTVTSRDYIPLLRLHSRRKDYSAAAADLRQVMAQGLELETIALNTSLSVCVAAPDFQLMDALLREVQEYEQKTGKAVVDIVTYNTMMKAAAKRRDVQACFKILDAVNAAKLDPDDVTFSTLLDVCIDENEHELASVALEQMCESGVKMNCVLLTTLMKGFIRSKHLDKAMALFDTMRSDGSQVKPDMITYSMLIKAQCDAQDMGKALQILEEMLQNSCEVDDVVFTHLIEGCCHVSNVQLAEKLFRDMLLAKIQPSVYTLTALVKVYGKCGQSEKAWEHVRMMEERFNLRPTVVIYTCLISGLNRQRKYSDAYQAFQMMRRSCSPDAQCVSTMVIGLAEAHMFSELEEVVHDALRRTPPLRLHNDCLSSALSALASCGEEEKARAFSAELEKAGFDVASLSQRRRGK